MRRPSPSMFDGKQLPRPQDYVDRQAAYDLKKFRGKELVRLVGKSRRYEPTPDGLQMISALMVVARASSGAAHSRNRQR